MSNSHLHPQAGGDPARAVSDDLKNEPRAPRDLDDFPDAPDESTDGRPQDKPDLDAFARRMGTDTIETGDAMDAVSADRSSATSDDGNRNAKVGIAAGGVAIAAVITFVVRRRRQRSLVSKALALGAAAKIISE